MLRDAVIWSDVMRQQNTGCVGYAIVCSGCIFGIFSNWSGGLFGGKLGIFVVLWRLERRTFVVSWSRATRRTSEYRRKWFLEKKLTESQEFSIKTRNEVFSCLRSYFSEVRIIDELLFLLGLSYVLLFPLPMFFIGTTQEFRSNLSITWKMLLNDNKSNFHLWKPFKVWEIVENMKMCEKIGK